MSDDFEIFYHNLSDEFRILFIGAFVFVAVLIFVVSVKLYQKYKKKKREKELKQEREMEYGNSLLTISPAYSTHCKPHK